MKAVLKTGTGRPSTSTPQVSARWWPPAAASAALSTDATTSRALGGANRNEAANASTTARGPLATKSDAGWSSMHNGDRSD